MRNNMRRALIVISLVIIAGFKNQDFTNRMVRINNIGWTFEIPLSLKLTDSSFNEKGDISPEKFKETFGQFSFEVFTINNFLKGSFDVYLWNNDKDSIQWSEYHKTAATNYFQNFAEIPNYKLLDSIYSEEIINQKKFKREYVKYYNSKDKDTINLFHYYSICNNKKEKINVELDISFAFADSSYGKKYFDLLNSSQFDD
jgi:hypothetical protein